MTKQDFTNGVELPPAKRSKNDGSSNGALELIAPHIMSSEESLKHEYESAKPYRHGRMERLFIDGFLEKVLEEVKRNTKVNFKESDLFRVYQSIDLGNLSEKSPEAKTLPSLMKLKATIYSPAYRAFIERITFLPPGTLTEQVDCAANCHAPGCHLLCHDDVIGTRKVSYIIYLTDPEPDWTADEGGCLELYDSTEEKVPEAFPSKTVLPIFNTMAYFVVEPGVSFHSVQEVFGDRPRLSLQGWYHAKETPAQMGDATLSRLKSTAKGEDTEGDFTPANWEDDEVENLSDSDRTYLSKFINETYLSESSMKEIRERFEQESSVQLRHFIQPQWLEKLNRAIAALDKDMGRGKPPLDYTVGVNDKWKAVGPAHKQRFLEFTGDPQSNGDNDAGAILLHLKQAIFQSGHFGRFLKLVTSLGMPTGYRGRVRRFRPGLDYTVAHYGILTTESVLDATLCFAAGKGDQSQIDEATGELIGSDDDAIWESGDSGGFECYIEADDEGDKQDAADEYNNDDDTSLLSVSASNNTLSLVYRDPGTMRFVKYVGSGAPSSRWDVSMEYEVVDDENNESDDLDADGDASDDET